MIIVRTRFRFKSRMRFVTYRILVKQRKVLERVGARVRGVMMHSIQSGRHRRSVENKPPRYRRGKAGGLRWVLFDPDINRHSVMIGPGRTVPKQKYTRGNQIVTVRSKLPVPALLNVGDRARFSVLYLSNGYQTDQVVKYRRFPIRDYAPTQTKARQIFIDSVANVKL